MKKKMFKNLLFFIILLLNNFLFSQDTYLTAKSYTLNSDESVQVSNFTNKNMTGEIISSGIIGGCFEYDKTCWYKVTLPVGFTNLKAVLTPKDNTKQLAMVMMSPTSAATLAAGGDPVVYSSTEVCATTPGEVLTSTRTDNCLPTKTRGYDVYIAIGSAAGTYDESDFTLELNAVKPTCSDNCQNQDETGVDVGGTCDLSTNCGTCALPDCKITHNTTITDAKLISTSDYVSADKFVPATPIHGKLSTCYTLTSDANGTIGIRLTENIHGSLPTNCTTADRDAIDATRKYTLVEQSGSCPGVDISPNKTNVANSQTLFNPEWYSLKPNTKYTLCVDVDIIESTGCDLYDIGLIYYHPSTSASIPCGKVGINWRNAANTPSNTDLTTCKDKDFELKANSIGAVTDNQFIAPGFDVDNDFGKINLSKIEIDQGRTGSYINTNLVKEITFCSPNVDYNIRLTGTVLSTGSGIIRIVDHATGEDLYVGPFTSPMVIPIDAGKMKGKAIFSGPGVSNHRLNYPSAGATSYIAAGYGFFNPSKAGNGTHTISYSWNNGNQDCGTATMTVEVKGCICNKDNGTQTIKINNIPPPASKTYATNSYGLCFDDEFKITTLNANPNVDYAIYTGAPTTNDPSTETTKYTEHFAETLGELIEKNNGNTSPVLDFLNNESITYSKNTIWWVPISTANVGGYNPACYDMDYQNESYKVTYLNDIKITATEVCASSKVTLKFEGGAPEFISGKKYNITTSKGSLSNSSVSTSGGTIDLTGLSTNDSYTISVTDEIGCVKTYLGSYTCAPCTPPTSTGTINAICAGSTSATSTTTLTLAGISGSPTSYSIDWDPVANTAGLDDITDIPIASTNLSIKNTVLANTYTGKISVKNANCTSVPQTITLTVNPKPQINGTTTLCEGTSATDWTPASGVTWSSSDPTKASVANGGTLSGFKQGTVTITATTANNCSATKTVTVNPIPAITPSIIDICEGSDPSLSYTGLTGNPDRIVFDPGLPGVSPFNLTLSASTTSPITISNLPAKLPVNTYSGVKVRVENSVTGCKSSDIAIAQFKVQATQKTSISSKGTSVNSVTFQWADLPGLQTQITGTSKDEYSIKEFVCSGCATAGTYVNATGTLTFNATSSRWEYVKNGLAPGSRVFIEVTPIDNAPLATPSCYSSSILDLTAIQCDAPVITKDLDNNIILCEGTTTSPVSTTISLEYNSADLTTPATWEILTPGGSWTALSNTGVYSITGSVNIDTKLTISNIKGLDGTKFRVNLKTPTVNGTCNTISNEVLLTVKPLPVMVPVADKSFCPGTLVNDPTKPKDFDLKITQSGTPTFNWSSDFQTTGVKLEGVNTNDGSKNVLDFESFTTSSPNNDAVSIITVTPTLNQCVGQPITFKITVKPTIKAAFAASDIDFNSVKFNWATSSVVPDFWVIDTLITGSTAATPSLSNYKSGGQQLGSVNTYSIIGINSSKKAYILVTPKQDPTKTELFCPVSIGFNGIPTPCVKPTKPLTPAITPICEGVALTINNVLADINANFQWKISTDAGTTWNNVSFSDFGNTGTTNVLSTQLTKAYMNKALVKVVVTDKQTGSCSEESNTATIVINELPNVKLIQPTSSSLCLDDNDVSAFIQPLSGKSPLKVDYTFNGVQKTNQDISNLEIKFSAKSVINYSLTVDKVIDANGCISSLTGLISQVAVHKNPTPNFAVSDTIGCYPLLINFTDISGEKYTNVTWDFGTGTNTSNDLGTTSFTYPKEGDYTVTYSVLDAFGCSGQIIKPNLIHVKSSPKAAITTDRNILSVYENVVKFDSKLSKNATFYQWDFGDNSPISNVPVVEHKYDPSVPGKFKISLIVSNSSTNMSCSDTAITWVDFPEEIVFFIPNTFTPNGDEFNNTFQPIFTSGYDPQNYSFIIFDRWGQIVFESNNPQVGWDGTYGDKILGNDTFVWKLGFKEKSSDNEHRSTGHVNLVK